MKHGEAGMGAEPTGVSRGTRTDTSSRSVPAMLRCGIRLFQRFTRSSVAKYKSF